jgi:hypothetical protein
MEHYHHFLLRLASDLKQEEFSLNTPEEAKTAIDNFDILLGKISEKLRTCESLKRTCQTCSRQGVERKEEEGFPQ